MTREVCPLLLQGCIDGTSGAVYNSSTIYNFL